MVPSHRPVGFADGAARPPVYGWDLIKSLKPGYEWVGFGTKSRLGETQPPRRRWIL